MSDPTGIAVPQSGVYRHYKGQHYLVLGLAHDANADNLREAVSEVMEDGCRSFGYRPLVEREVVVYVPLELTGAHTGARMAVRTLEDFQSLVCAAPDCRCYGQVFGYDPDGDPCAAEHAVRRFTYLGPRWQP